MPLTFVIASVPRYANTWPARPPSEMSTVSLMSIVVGLSVAVENFRLGIRLLASIVLKPMMLRDTATPMLAPTPVDPAATAADAAMTDALILPVDVAVTETPVTAPRSDPTTSAATAAVMVLVAKAPAPEIAMPVDPNPAATAAASAVLFSTDASEPATSMLPAEATTPRVVPVMAA